MTLPEVCLRDVRDEDVPLFYRQRLDPIAIQMAAFPPRDWPIFAAHWERIRQNGSSIVRTILVDGEVAGTLESFVQDGQRLVGYWLGRAFWGQGIATRALRAFLQEITTRPLFAQVVEHNAGSRRVLEKNGFRLVEIDRVLSEELPAEMSELLLRLD